MVILQYTATSGHHVEYHGQTVNQLLLMVPVHNRKLTGNSYKSSTAVSALSHKITESNLQSVNLK